jgi:hypothetical protein
MSRWYWALSSIWETGDPAGYDRHEVFADDAAVARAECGRRWNRRGRLVLRSSRAERLEDLPFSLLPLMSGRAVGVLRDLLARDGEFVPVRLKHRGRLLSAEYYVFNCLRRYDAIDRRRVGRSHWLRKGVLRSDAPWRFSYSRVPIRVNAFRPRHVRERLLVSEIVADRLKASDLSGWMLCDPEDPPWRRRSVVSPHRPVR